MDWKQQIQEVRNIAEGLCEVKPWFGFEKDVELLESVANRLELAERLIADLEGHDGAKGFSKSTYELLGEWYDNP